MDIFVSLERFRQSFIPGKMGEDPQFNLGLVCGGNAPSFFGNKGLPNPISLLRTDGDVLEVGIARGEPARCRYRLIIRGVDPPGLGMDQFGQSIDVSRFEFAQITVTEDLQGKVVLKRELFQNLAIG